MVVLCGMPTIQYSARSARLSMHKLFASCIRRGQVSRDSIVDGDWLPATELCQRYLPCCQPRRTSQKIWGGFLYGVYIPREWIWIDSNGRNETRNPTHSYFGNEFPAICNHCGVMVAWSRKALKMFEKFLLYFEKRSLTVKCSKFCSEKRKNC